MHPLEMIFYWAKIKPGHLAIVQPQMALTYRGLAEGVKSVLRRIENCGLNRNEPVAVSIRDSAKFLTVCLALWRSGFNCAPVNLNIISQLSSHKINNLIVDSESDVLSSGRNVRFDESWLKLSAPARSGSSDERGIQKALTASFIFFTSGTTGIPKKVVMPNAALIERMKLITIKGESDYGKAIIVPGLASMFGFNRAIAMLYAGQTIFFGADADDPTQLIETFGIETIISSPQQALSLVELAETAHGHRFDSLKEIDIAGGYMSPEQFRRVQTRLCRRVVCSYGATEAGLVAFANYDRISDIPNAVGIAAPGVTLQIVDELNNVLPAGEEGLVRGQSRFISEMFAANNPERASEAENAWWYPGDLGWFHEGDILCIGGRTDDVINCGGVKLSAASLDEIVCRQPGVRDGAVCAVRGLAGVEEIWVAVVTDGQEDTAALKQAIEKSQSHQVRVGEVLGVEKIPRNNLGKLQRHELKALLLGIKNRQLAQADC
jgi:acyl-coenzyme A synthetase/AMP-(fatty) acid ligase